MHRGIFTEQFLRLTATHFFYWICLDIFIPILPRHYHIMGMSDFEIGLIIGAISLSGVIFRIPAGKSLNRYGTAPVLGAGLILSLLGIIGHFFAASAHTAILSAALQGLGLACYGSAALTMASLMFEDKDMVDVFAIFTMASMCGVSLSIGTANWVYGLGGISSIVCIGLFAVCMALLVFPKHPPVVAKIKKSATLALSKIIVNPKIYIPTVSIFSTYFCFSGAMTFFPLLMLSRGISDFNIFFASYSISVVLFRFMTVKYCHSFELRHLEGAAVVLAGGTMLALAAADNRLYLVFCGLIIGAAMGIGYPVMVSTVAGNSAPANRGVALSVFASSADFGFVAGATGLSLIAGFLDYSSVFVIAGGITILYFFAHCLWLSKKLAMDNSNSDSVPEQQTTALKVQNAGEKNVI